MIGITGHNSAREKTAGQVRSYRLHAPSPPLQRSHPAIIYAGPKQCARFGARGSAARASHRIAAATLSDQETRADRAPVFIRRCSFRPSPRIFLEGTTFAASHRSESVMRRIPRDRRASRTPRPLPRVALRRCARPANSAPPTLGRACARVRITVRYPLPHRVQPTRHAEASALSRARARVRVRVRDDCRPRACVCLCRGYYIPMDCRCQSSTLWLRTRKDAVARQILSRASVNGRLCVIRDRLRRVRHASALSRCEGDS